MTSQNLPDASLAKITATDSNDAMTSFVCRERDGRRFYELAAGPVAPWAEKVYSIPPRPQS